MNVSIIVFSRGRSLQLHAYLESLLKFSDAKQNMIHVLYSPMEQIGYEKVMKCYPNVQWKKENDFSRDLRKMIEDAGTYVMFGCDDVVFRNYFSMDKAITYLELYPDLFGFSMRLGENIKPCPKDMERMQDILIWNWQNSKEAHYNYPWELDCTLYRKEDVKKLILEEETTIKNPNFLEAMITAENKKERIVRTKMAAWKESCAVVITVNRVQDTHPNDFDACMATDIYSFERLYNDKGNTLNIERIAKKETNKVHVGAEYFILRKYEKGFSKGNILKKRIKRIFKKIPLFCKRIYRFAERRYYLAGGYQGRLRILTPEETLTLLETKKISFLRYGDGEIAIMQGKSIPFQKYDAQLSKRLNQILRMGDKNLKIGIPYYYINPPGNLNSYVKCFAGGLAQQRRFLLKMCKSNEEYIDTCITQMYQTYETYDFTAFFQRMQSLLRDKDVTVICGGGILDKLRYNALDVCKSVEYLYAAKKNAFAEYDKLLERALKTDKSRLICISLGPTAKALVYDLCKNGYQAWDMGHYFKDYDAYRKNAERTKEEIVGFYKPD